MVATLVDAGRRVSKPRRDMWIPPADIASARAQAAYRRWRLRCCELERFVQWWVLARSVALLTSEDVTLDRYCLDARTGGVEHEGTVVSQHCREMRREGRCVHPRMAHYDEWH